MHAEPAKVVLKSLLPETVGLIVTVWAALGLMAYFGGQPWAWTALAASSPIAGVLFVVGVISRKVAIASPRGLVVRYEPIPLAPGLAYHREELLGVTVEEDPDPEGGRSTWRVVLLLLRGGTRTVVTYRDPLEAGVVAEQLRDALR